MKNSQSGRVLRERDRGIECVLRREGIASETASLLQIGDSRSGNRILASHRSCAGSGGRRGRRGQLGLDRAAGSPQASLRERRSIVSTLGEREGTRSDGDRRATSHCYGRAARGAGSARAAGRAGRGGAGRAAARAGEGTSVRVRAHGRARLRGADRRLAGLVRRRERGALPPLLAPLPHRLAAAARDGRPLPATRRLVDPGPSTAARCAAVRLSVRNLRLDLGQGGGELRPGPRLAARGDRRRHRPGLPVGGGRRVRAWLARSAGLPGAALPPARPARPLVLPLPARCRR
jgi:hypothetical protein